MNHWRGFFRVSLCVAALLVGCQAAAEQPAGNSAPTQPSLVEQAALEATRIIQQAQATALVLQAQAQATAMIIQAGAATPVPGQLAAAQPGNTPASTSAPQSVSSTPSRPDATPIAVAVTGVGFAADGGMLIVRFMAPEKEAAKWWQGSVQVIQESTQQVYGEIPVMPVIGPLISRPKQDGKPGYVMLYHNPALLQTSDLVTVILGNYKFEHVEVGK